MAVRDDGFPDFRGKLLEEMESRLHSTLLMMESKRAIAVPVHGDNRGMPAMLIELRQDLLAQATGIAGWARQLADALLARRAKVAS